MTTNKAAAVVNMQFNDKSFKKDKIYDFRYEENGSVCIISEEKKEQLLTFQEFDMLFKILAN